MAQSVRKLYLQIFIEPELRDSSTSNLINTPDTTASTLSVGNRSPRNNNNGGGSSGATTGSSMGRHLSSVGSSYDNGGSRGSRASPGPARSTEYTYVSVTPDTRARDVIGNVAKKRNVFDQRHEYCLVMCDSDGKQIIERVLGADDIPFDHQQAAQTHGHLGDFHFVFRKNVDDDDDSDQEIFAPNVANKSDHSLASKLSNGKDDYPSGWMEKRGKTHRGWKRRYFVLIEDNLWYYKDKTTYEKGKDPIASIELTKPAAIIKIVFDGENAKKNANNAGGIASTFGSTFASPSLQSIDAASIIGTITHGYGLNSLTGVAPRSRNSSTQRYYYFDIHTPKRIYSLKVDDYDTMIEWIQKLQRRNTPNELLNSLDHFMADSEHMHGEEDEKTLDQFSNLDNILTNPTARKYYRNYLKTNYIDEFIDFWDALTHYLSNYHTASQSKQLQMAQKIFDEFIARGSKRELSEIRTRDRNSIKKMLASGYVTKETFGDIQSSVYNHLNADVWKFFHSIEYYKFIVTYKQNSITSEELNNNKYAWPKNYSEIYLNEEKGQRSAPKIHIPSFVTGKKNMHSPVYLGRSYNTNGSNANSLAGPNGSNTISSSLSPRMTAQTWNGGSGVLGSSPSGGNSVGNGALRGKPKKRKGFGQSVFENAPGL